MAGKKPTKAWAATSIHISEDDREENMKDNRVLASISPQPSSSSTATMTPMSQRDVTVNFVNTRLESIGQWSLPPVVHRSRLLQRHVSVTESCRLDVTPAVSDDGQLVACVHSNGRHILLMESGAGSATRLNDHLDKITCLTFAGNVYLMTSSLDGTLKLWRLRRNVRDVTCTRCLVFREAVMMVHCDMNRKIFCVHLRSEVILVRSFSQPEEDELRVAIKDCQVTVIACPTNCLAYGTDDGRVYVWHVVNQKAQVDCVKASKHGLSICELVAAGHVFATCAESETRIIIWSSPISRRLYEIDIGDDVDPVGSLAIFSRIHPLMTDIALIYVRGSTVYYARHDQESPCALAHLDSSVLHLLSAPEVVQCMAITSSKHVVQFKVLMKYNNVNRTFTTQGDIHNGDNDNSGGEPSHLVEVKSRSTACVIL